MSFNVHFRAYVPPERFDGKAYERVEIEEAAASTGPWTLIDTLTFSPLDSDPSHPIERSFTTTKAALEAGWYRVRYIDTVGNRTPYTAPQANRGARDEEGYRPSIASVASLLRARTLVTGGTEVGTFDTRTRPTADQVEMLIDDAEDEVLGKIKTPPAGSKREQRAQGAIRLYAAILIELSYFPEQVKSGKSAADTYQKLYESRIKALVEEGEEEEPSAEHPDAAWAFPEGTGGLVGWGSRWLYDDAAWDAARDWRRR